MKKIFLFFITLLFTINTGIGQERIDSLMPVRGLCVGAPNVREVDDFVKFINNELVPGRINTIILMVDYRYRFESHPELRDSDFLSKSDVKKIVEACRKGGIKIIPQINMLGHQSWASKPGKLLEVYPEFDETPSVKFPEKYVWPNADKLYCKSYCPLYPGLHKVIFDVIDEICDAFETNDFHAGMDEVFYIGEDQCPRCSGRDKAELFAGEVSVIRNHLAEKGRKLWIWGDRLLDGKTTGLGEWEASYNNTYRAVDMIPKDVIICDWHYERADQTAVYFAMKGFHVVTCPWRVTDVALNQVNDMLRFRQTSTPEMRERFLGIVHTQWSGFSRFAESYYSKNDTKTHDDAGQCFKIVLGRMKNIGSATEAGK